MEWPVDHIDFIIVFFNNANDRYDIFVKQLLAYNIRINLICKLLKALYRQKQFLQI